MDKFTNKRLNKNLDIKHKGYVLLPYITKNVSTSINGETVWYANKWKNLLLKIKHFFIKPKYLKNVSKYKNKKVDSSQLLLILFCYISFLLWKI